MGDVGFLVFSFAVGLGASCGLFFCISGLLFFFKWRDKGRLRLYLSTSSTYVREAGVRVSGLEWKVPFGGVAIDRVYFFLSDK